MPAAGAFSVPRGPCMNVLCAEGLNCDITCTCPFGGAKGAAHSLFSPTCVTLRYNNDRNVVPRSSEVKFPKASAIELGRAHGRRDDRDEHDDKGVAGSARPKQQQMYWKHLTDADRTVLGCVLLLPEKAVACHTCQALASKLERGEDADRLEHAKAIALGNTEALLRSLPVEAVQVQAAYATNQVWLGSPVSDADEEAATRQQHGIWSCDAAGDYTGGTCTASGRVDKTWRAWELGWFP